MAPPIAIALLPHALAVIPPPAEIAIPFVVLGPQEPPASTCMACPAINAAKILATTIFFFPVVFFANSDTTT